MPCSSSVRRCVGSEALVHERVGGPGDGPQRDVRDVVGDAPAVRVAGEVAADDAERVRARSPAGPRRSVASCPPTRLCCVAFWKPGTTPAGMPVSRIATRSSRAAGERFQVREHLRGRAPAAASPVPGAARTAGTRFFARAACAFHSSLRAIGMSTSLNSGLASRETCTHGPDSECSLLAPSAMRTLRRLAEPQTPSTAFELITFVGTEPFDRQLADRDLDRDRVAVERLQRVHARRRRRRDQVQVLDRTQVRRGRRSTRCQRRTDRCAARRTPSGRPGASGSLPRRASRSSGSSAGRCCRAGTRGLPPARVVAGLVVRA